MSSLREYSSRFITDRHGLMAFILGLIRNPDAAEDVFQEVWIELAEAADRGLVIECPEAWCRGVARNLVLRYWQRQRRDRLRANSLLLERAEQAFAEADSPAARERLASYRNVLRECIAELPGQSRAVLRMKYDDDAPVQSIADALGKSVASVKMLLLRMRRLLEACSRRKLLLAGDAP